MKITKLWHCCLLIETKGKRLLTDPGTFTAEAHAKLENIDAILFTHEHADHYHLDSLQLLLQRNKEVTIFSNTSVGALLDEAWISHTVIHDGETIQFGEIALTGVGHEHAIIHPSLPIFANTGYFIDENFFYPGDAFIDPKKSVDILALPVCWPWLKLSEALDYAIKIHPRVAFPVHDFIRIGPVHTLPAKFLPENGIEFIPMVEGDSHEF